MNRIEVIAEIGSNWDGEVAKAKRAIKLCKEAGVDKVKFQMWRAKDLYSSSHPYWQFIKAAELKKEIAEELFDYSKDIGIEWFASVFYPEAVDALERIGVRLYKVASRTCTLKDPGARETLEAIAKTRKPVFISMGEGGDKGLITQIFEKSPATFMYVISNYPTKEEEINWSEAVKYDAFSDHTMANTASIVFSALKALQHKKGSIAIERHVRLDDSSGPDAPISLTMAQMKDLVDNAKRVERLAL